MKKIKLLLGVFVLVVFLSGCGSDNSSGSEATSKSLDINLVKSNVKALKIDDDTPFADDANINDSDSIETYGLDVDLLDEYVIYLPSAVVNASMYIVAKPKEGEESVVKYQIKELFDKYYNAYNGYYPKEAKLIEGRMEKELSGYYIYIVSNDNEKVYNAIKESLK